MTIHGYARPTSTDPTAAQQIAELKRAGATVIHTDLGGAVQEGRPKLYQCISEMTAGDTLVVYRLDRLARSLAGLVSTLYDLQTWQIDIVALTEGIDTRKAAASSLRDFVGALVSFEKDVVAERKAPVAPEDKAPSGRRKSVDLDHALILAQAPGATVKSVASQLGIHRANLYRVYPEVVAALKARTEKVAPSDLARV